MEEKPWYQRNKYWLISLAVIILILIFVGGNTLSRNKGWIAETYTPEALSDLLRPYYKITLPTEQTGTGQVFPTIIIAHGCDGPRENTHAWIEAFADAGWASVAIDSHNPRGYIETEQWRLVCTAQLLSGQERAGDIIVGYADVLKMPFVDTQNIVLFGISHGGWAVGEAMLDMEKNILPPTLSAWPDNLANTNNKLSHLIAEMMLYPYAGILSNLYNEGWKYPAPTLFLIAGSDIVVSNNGSLRLIGELQQNGIFTDIRVYPDATHGFDQPKKAGFSPLEFDEETRNRAMNDTIKFLESVLK